MIFGVIFVCHNCVFISSSLSLLIFFFTFIYFIDMICSSPSVSLMAIISYMEPCLRQIASLSLKQYTLFAANANKIISKKDEPK